MILVSSSPIINNIRSVQIEEVLLPQLASDRLAVRKRAIGALSNLVAVCNNTLFAKTMVFLIDELKANRSLSTTRTYVAAVASIARAAGHRFSEYLPKVWEVVGFVMVLGLIDE